MRTIVTGGAGFLGSHLCEKLLKEGYEVIALDNLATGKTKNIKHLLDDPNFVFIRHNVSKPFEINEKIDAIFHLASPASPIDYQEIPINTISANAFGTYNMLVLTKRNNAKFLLASTSEAYGDPKVHPQREDYWGNVNPVGIRSCYDESKRLAEALTMAFYRKYDIDVRIIRIFNTYGPRMRMDDGRVIPNFAVQSLMGKPITVYGDGTQTRSFCYVDDLIEGIYRAMFKEGTKGEIINLGNPDEKNMLELAEVFKKITGSNSEITFKPLPKDDPARRRPDISKAKKLLGWEPKVSLEEGLKRTLDWFEDELKTKNVK
ncbi:MAG: SDR family oxidoreductase [Candidatus Aenigmarchaeota archaeon]|nr:SDR family oxidoreductase [Candidatus Aenigmarchaeota archaeon]